MRVATLALALVAVSSVSSAPLPDNARRSLYGNSVDHAASQLEGRGVDAETVIKETAQTIKSGDTGVYDTLNVINKENKEQFPDERQLLETLTNTPSRQATFKDHSGTQEKNLERSSSLKQTSGGIGGSEDPNEAVNNKILSHLAEDEAKKFKKGKEVEMIPKPSKSSTAIKALSLLGVGGVLGAGVVGVSAAIRYQHRLDRCLAAKDKDKLAPDCSNYIHNSSSPEAYQKRKEFGFPEPAVYRPFGPLRHL